MIADEILKERYYQDGEDWEKLCRRVAHAISQGQAGQGMEEIFYDCLLNKKFLPNSPTLMNAGLDGTLSACFTVDVEDNMDSIFDTVKNMAIIGKWGGGCGNNWSTIRAKGSQVGSTNGVASGPVSFLEMVDTMAEVIKQGGRRRMAVMSILDVDHPDIKEFITVKDDSTKLKNMNMSVMITDEFMEKVENGNEDALDIWNLIIKYAWKNSEPGVLFYDRINKDNFTPQTPINVSNPCSEESMIPYSSCNLISINLSKLVNDGIFNWNEFRNLIDIAIKFADSTIDVNKFPLKKIEEVTKSLRPVGLGVLGFAHCLIKLGIIYGSKESYEFADQLFSFMKTESIMSSTGLGDEFGYFPVVNESTVDVPRRNCYLRSIAPTGTIATIADSASFSIEPCFTIAYERNVLNQTFNVVDPLFEEMIVNAGLNKDRIFNLVKGKSSIQDIEEIPENIRKLFITAHDLSPEQHVKMIATIQPYIDTGISKTVNAPENITIDEVDALYKYAWKNGCKGITIYRANSREAPIKLDTPHKIDIDYKAPDTTFGPEVRISVACGHFLCSVTGVGEQPLKITNSPTTGCCDANLEALQRISSLALRSGINPELITKQLDKVKCSACGSSPKAEHKSCAAGISSVIKLYDDFYKSVGEVNLNNVNKSTNTLIKCTNCDKEFEPNTKCSVCPHCGYSRCG